MNLYKISQTENRGYDSAIVVAESEEAARRTNPYGETDPNEQYWYWEWCRTPEQVKVRFIGVAAEGIKAGVICASHSED